MIEKFIHIQNVGRFRDCKAKGDVSFRKLNLLFAENGRGKTTLCAILRSLQSGQSAFISERKTLGAAGSASVQIRFVGSTASFANNAWSATHSEIAIFDSVFIHDNVYAGDYVEHDHKKNLYRVIVGAQGVQLASQIANLDAQIRDANTDIKNKRDAAMISALTGVTIESYLSWQAIPDIESRIQEKTTEITNRQRALEKAGEIQSKALLAKIQLLSLPPDFNSLLAKQLADLTAGAEATVRQQVSDYQMENHGESWLSQGLGYVRNDRCPFCGQGVQANTLIAAYRSHFNEAYKALKQEVAQLGQRVKRAIGETPVNAALQPLSANLALVEFWKQFVEISLPAIALDDIQVKYARLRELALALAHRKQENPIEAVTPNDEFTTALSDLHAIQIGIDAYNASIDTCNARISAQKTSVQRGGDVNALKAALADLEAKKKRFEPAVVQACQVYQAAVTAKAALDQQKETAKRQLDQYCQNILHGYEQAINAYLDQFSAGFRITNSRHLYTGGTPSSHYQIQINNVAIDLGDSRTQSGTPCFKTALSSGDRSALALAFFLAALKQDPHIASKIVVLDDPFTSLDRFRRTCTQQLIRQLALVVHQVIVLSHDPLFLKLIWDSYPPAEIKVLQLSQSGNTTLIGEFDIEAETQSVYLKNYSTLLNFYRDRTGTPLDVARAIRPFLEGLLRSRFPGHFQPAEWLGDFIGKIRAAGPNDGLHDAQTDLQELKNINDYSKKYHHDQNARADSEAISTDELHGFVKRTLRLVGGS